MKNRIFFGTSVAAVLVSQLALAAGVDVGEAAKQATNWTAILMFGAFVVLTLWITKWAASRTRSAADFLHGRRWHHRLPERFGDCRRLYVCGLFLGHFGSRHGDRL